MLGAAIGRDAAARRVAAAGVADPRREADAASAAAAFDRPERVLDALKAACLDWTFWGGAWEGARAPRAPCL